jgi:uncharacterized membrane protein YkoI
MRRTMKVAIAAGVVATGIGVGAAAVDARSSDKDTPITGTALERASAAALAHTGGGRVTGTEVGDEDSYYEVEVTVEDGRQVDVQLDRNFTVVGSKRDREDASDASGS